MHDLDPKRHCADIVQGGFFNEAFTQMLTLQMFPECIAYEPQVKMVTFANLLGGLLPMLAQKVGLDPALMATPMITSLTDMASAVTYLLIASALLGIAL